MWHCQWRIIANDNAFVFFKCLTPCAFQLLAGRHANLYFFAAAKRVLACQIACAMDTVIWIDRYSPLASFLILFLTCSLCEFNWRAMSMHTFAAVPYCFLPVNWHSRGNRCQALLLLWADSVYGCTLSQLLLTLAESVRWARSVITSLIDHHSPVGVLIELLMRPVLIELTRQWEGNWQVFMLAAS